MSSRPEVFIAGGLSFLQDLSIGSNIPRSGTSRERCDAYIQFCRGGAKRHKTKARELAKEVYNSVKQIMNAYPAPASSSTLDPHAESVREFLRALEDVAAFVDKLGRRSILWRFFNHLEDRQELSEYRMKIGEAKLQFLISVEMAKVQTLKREQQYPVFKLADLELQQVLNPMHSGHSRVVARLVPYQKRVMVRRYATTLNFLPDIEHLIPLRHPNLPFLGASSLSAPQPFVVMELDCHTPVHDVIQSLYDEPRRVLQRKAINIILGVLEAMHHLRKNRISLPPFN
ncbi:hypothetical protein C8F01DRAFT_1264730 [Mycena amicta]|nr:hypothetical protein C8F01DRAFT_1264730 [Mycena amicta]